MSALYGEVQLSRVARASVFENRRGKSCIAIQATVPVPHLGLAVDAAIWARLASTPDGFEVTFEASLPRGFKALKDGADEAFLSHVENAAAKWNGYDAATQSAYNLLTGTKAAPVAGQAPKDMRPRLVFAPKAAPVAAPAPAPTAPTASPTAPAAR